MSDSTQTACCLRKRATMNLDLTPEEAAFRAEVRAFLERELTPDVWRAHRDLSEQGMWTADFTKAFRRKLGAAGYIGMGWARAGGGGELSWFVGYSEPEAGSDLANLKTRAVEDGDDFIITGQKSFSSEAHMADYGWVAGRPHAAMSKHRGLSLFIVDMKSPGVVITKHPTLAGWTHHAVYFDQVRVPRSMMVGELHEGWKVVMGAIDFERAALASHGLIGFQLDRLLAWCGKERDGAPRRLDDPLVRDELVRLAIEGEGARLMTDWVAFVHARGLMPPHETPPAGVG